LRTQKPRIKEIASRNSLFSCYDFMDP
jgi:hypothetical protein